MKNLKKVLSLMLCSILSVGAMSLAACTNKEKEPLNQDSFKITQEYNSGITIATLCSEVIATGSELYLSKQLEATILNGNGTTSTDCSWSVYWADANNKEDVSEYVQVQPQSQKNKVFVNCYKPFYDNTIVIEVTANATGHKAVCICEYIGIPSSPYFEINGNIFSNYAEISLNPGLWEFDLGLMNVLGPVDSTSANFELGEIYGSGQFKATNNTVGGDNNITSTEMTVDMAESWRNFVNVTLEDNVLKVNIIQAVNTYYISGNRGWIEFEDFMYPAVMAGKPLPCTIHIPVTENTTGVTMLIVLSPLNNVTLNEYALKF